MQAEARLGWRIFIRHANNTKVAQRREIAIMSDQSVCTYCKCARSLHRIRKFQFEGGTEASSTFCDL